MNYQTNQSPEEVLAAIKVIQKFCEANSNDRCCNEVSTDLDLIEDWVNEDIKN